ncbi:MAG: proline dehydrogenase family protein [Bacteroidetes bacterium]|nr:proline dehydrogenase family protein [Bacteroidota bacterium]
MNNSPEQLDFSFNNTEIAFQSKSNSALNKAHLLFKSLGISWLVNSGPGLLKFAYGIHLPINGLIKKTIFSQFCGGENINECQKAIEELNKYHVGTILDYSVEGEETTEAFEATAKETIQTINKAAGNPAIPFSVFKVTGVARFELLENWSTGKPLSESDQKEFDITYNRIKNICEHAHNKNVRIFIDAEETWIQPAIDYIAEQMMELYNKEKCIVYNTLQLYRHDRLQYLKDAHKVASDKKYFLGVKLVRGAYMEKERQRAIDKGYPSPIQPDKASSDRDYNATLDYCISHLQNICVCAGTHNEDSSYKLAQLMKENGIKNNDQRIYFSQLLGMSDHISFNLAKAGYNVAKYVPYGPVKSVLPYLIRRAQENSSAKGQAGRELTLIETELKRRKLL